MSLYLRVLLFISACMYDRYSVRVRQFTDVDHVVFVAGVDTVRPARDDVPSRSHSEPRVTHRSSRIHDRTSRLSRRLLTISGAASAYFRSLPDLSDRVSVRRTAALPGRSSSWLRRF